MTCSQSVSLAISFLDFEAEFGWMAMIDARRPESDHPLIIDTTDLLAEHFEVESSQIGYQHSFAAADHSGEHEVKSHHVIPPS